MRTRHTRKLASLVLLLIALACAWTYFAPTSIGGPTTYVVTSGVSMEPRFHTGDLALVRSQSSYRVGEIVAYHSKMFHTIVLHRIVGQEGDRYLFKGDHNSWVDFEHPARSQLIGALFLHIPGAGARIDSLRSPLLIAVLFAVGTLMITGVAIAHRRRRRRRERDGGGAPPRAQPRLAHGPPGVLGDMLGICLLALAPFVLLGLLAFTRPASAPTPTSVPYHQTGALSYAATATPGPAYQEGRAVTGDPLFTRVVNLVQLHFGYLFHAAAPHSVHGQLSLSAALSSTSGWHSSLPLGPPVPFQGNRAAVEATLNLSEITSLVHSVEQDTRVSGSYTLTLLPHATVAGTLDGAPLHAAFSPKVQFLVSELELQPIDPGSGSPAQSQSLMSVFAPSQGGSATETLTQPRTLSLLLLHIRVGEARWIALVGILLVAGAVAAILKLARRRPDDDADSILARYGSAIVPVARVWQLPDVPVIDVADMDALVRIAEHYDRSILHETDGDVDAFWVTDESGQFRFSLGAGSGRPRAPRTGAPARPASGPGAAAAPATLRHDTQSEPDRGTPLVAVAEPSPPQELADPDPASTLAQEPVLAQEPASPDEPEPAWGEPASDQSPWTAAPLPDEPEPAWGEPASDQSPWTAAPLPDEPAPREPDVPVADRPAADESPRPRAATAVALLTGRGPSA